MTIEITGCGRGSRLICEGGIFLLGEDLASFALRHLDMQFKGTDESPLQMLGVREFTLEDCQITQESFSRALVWVAAAERIRFSDSTLRQGFPDDDEIATALAISDPRADTTWDNCRFIGHVLLYAEEFTPAGVNSSA